jgi:hypothetical protein
MVKDGIEFQVMLNTTELQTNGKLYAKAKVTNVSEETIPYLGYDGCDLGVSSSIIAESDDKQAKVGS